MGLRDGCCVVGLNEGLRVGMIVGLPDGLFEGLTVTVGCGVGDIVGTFVFRTGRGRDGSIESFQGFMI